METVDIEGKRKYWAVARGGTRGQRRDFLEQEKLELLVGWEEEFSWDRQLENVSRRNGGMAPSSFGDRTMWVQECRLKDGPIGRGKPLVFWERGGKEGWRGCSQVCRKRVRGWVEAITDDLVFSIGRRPRRMGQSFDSELTGGHHTGDASPFEHRRL